VEQQRALIAEMDRDGRDTAELKRLLEQFEQMLAREKADRELLREEIAELGER